MAKWNTSASLHIETCSECGTKFGMSDSVYQVARQRHERGAFFCPNGHRLHYPSGESEEDKLRRERDQIKQQLARLEDEKRAERKGREAAERSARAYKGAATRMKNRAKAGICPCCNRHFTDLERHMKTKHTEVDLTNVVEFGQTG